MDPSLPFTDRAEAGRHLARAVADAGLVDDGHDVVVVGLPRGGVPVAAVVAESLGAPLDIVLVRKLGLPHQPELAMGAIGEGGARFLNTEVLRAGAVSPDELAAVERRERAELDRRARLYREGREPLDLTDRTVVIVDDGIATGSTAHAACHAVRHRGAGRVVLAMPVAPADWSTRLADAADRFVAVATPEPFYGVGQFYRDFRQTSDEEVIELLRAAQHVEDDGGRGNRVSPRDEIVTISAGGATVEGHLVVPEGATGIVLFAHGSGSSRHSSRNRFVAGVLNDAGLATLLFDLLTPHEELDRSNVFDVGLLATRLGEALRWVRGQADLASLPVGLFGASTGAAAALVAASRPGCGAATVVSRGGRPDLAGAALADVSVPVLLLVGGRDFAVLDLNRSARERLTCPSELRIIPGATHLFEEPGTLAAAADAAREWFLSHLVADRGVSP